MIKRAKCKMLVIVITVLVVLILGVYTYVNNPDLNPPKDSVTIEAIVTEIHGRPSGES